MLIFVSSTHSLSLWNHPNSQQFRQFRQSQIREARANRLENMLRKMYLVEMMDVADNHIDSGGVDYSNFIFFNDYFHALNFLNLDFRAL